MERDKNGKWLKGQSGNLNGRPKRECEEEYLKILVSVCTPARWKAIIDKAVAQAVGGDDKARKWLSDHTLGLPMQKLALTDPSGERSYDPSGLFSRLLPELATGDQAGTTEEIK